MLPLSRSLFPIVVLCGLTACGSKQPPALSSAVQHDSGKDKPTATPTPSASKVDEAEAKARFQVVSDLQMLAHTMKNFASRRNGDELPMADGSGSVVEFGEKKELAGYSWRVPLLASMSSDRNKPGQEREIFADLQKRSEALAGKKPGEIWNVPELKSIPLAMLSCPVKGKTAEPWLTVYRVFQGPGAAFEAGKQTKYNRMDFPDGLDKTILIVACADGVPWPKPEELTYDPKKPLPKIEGLFSDGVYAAFADGSVRFIKNGTDEKSLRALITRNGGETISELPPLVDYEALRKAAGYKD